MTFDKFLAVLKMWGGWGGVVGGVVGLGEGHFDAPLVFIPPAQIGSK